MIGIYSTEHLARAMWADREEVFRRECEALRLPPHPYRTIEWEVADPLDREEYMERADRVVRLCRIQALDLVKKE